MSLYRETTAASQRQALVTVEGLELVWHSMTGGGMSVEYTLDDSSMPSGVTVGRRRAEPIVVTTTVSPERDLGWMRRVKAMVGVARFTITRQWTDPNWVPVGDPEVYADCLLVGYTNPETSPSTDDAVFSLSFVSSGESL